MFLPWRLLSGGLRRQVQERYFVLWVRISERILLVSEGIRGRVLVQFYLDPFIPFLYRRIKN